MPTKIAPMAVMYMYFPYEGHCRHPLTPMYQPLRHCEQSNPVWPLEHIPLAVHQFGLAHWVQINEPLTFAANPPGQAAHAADVVAPAKVPLAQSVHAVAEAEAYLPAAQTPVTALRPTEVQ